MLNEEMHQQRRFDADTHSVARTRFGNVGSDKAKLSQQNINFENLNTLIHLGSTESIKNFLQDFDGLAIVSEKAVQNELYMKTLVKLKVTGFTIPRKLSNTNKDIKANRSSCLKISLLCYNMQLSNISIWYLH